MKLATLKTLLQSVIGSDIKQVTFDLNKWPANDNPAQLFPAIVWNFNNVKFKKDIRTTTIQKEKAITLTVFAMIAFDPTLESEDDKIGKWDTLEGYFETYINAVNALSRVKVVGIDKINGFYIPEGISDIFPHKALGIMYDSLELHTYCSG
jgi:hypothetical protein